MLKWAALFLILLVVTGILGFVLKVAGFIFQLLFVVCLIGFAVVVGRRWLSRLKG